MCLYGAWANYRWKAEQNKSLVTADFTNLRQDNKLYSLNLSAFTAT